MRGYDHFRSGSGSRSLVTTSLTLSSVVEMVVAVRHVCQKNAAVFGPGWAPPVVRGCGPTAVPVDAGG